VKIQRAELSMKPTGGWSRRVVNLACVLALLTVSAAPAQTPPAPGTSGGTATERRVPTAPQAAPTPPAVPDMRVPAQPPAPGAALVPFTLVGVVIDGATAIDPERLVPLYAPLIASTVTAADLAGLAEAIAAFYRDAGYPLASAFIPPQAIVSGIVRVQVAEGHVAALTFEGAPGEAPIVRETMRAVTAERPLRLATLERRLLLLDDIPGVRVTDARVRAIDVATGAYELIVKLESSPFDAFASLDNRGTRSNGPWQLFLSGGTSFFQGDGAWRVHGGVLTNPFSPRETRFGTVGVQRTLGSSGTMLNASVSANDDVAGKPDSDEDQQTRSARFVIGVTHPLLRSRSRSLWAGVSFDALRSAEDRFGTVSSRDNLRVLRAISYLVQADPWGGENTLSFEGSYGLDAFGASPQGSERSRDDASGRFAKLRVDAARTQRLMGPVSAHLALSGQTASRPLLSSEEFSLGGARYGRAFDPSELSGERGWAGVAELRWADPVQLHDRLASELFAFVDTGVIWNDLPGKDSREYLSSAGLGVRLRTDNGLRLGAEVATPLDSSSRELRSQGTRFFLTLAFEY
jgi:hemolysin activation/secretion protein